MNLSEHIANIRGLEKRIKRAEGLGGISIEDRTELELSAMDILVGGAADAEAELAERVLAIPELDPDRPLKPKRKRRAKKKVKQPEGKDES